MAEVNIPIIKNLDLGIAVRYDDYSDVGRHDESEGVTALAGEAEPAATWVVDDTGFRAPTLYDLYQPSLSTFTASPYDDPVLCPGGVPVAGADPARDCNIQFSQQFGGNTAVQPETSDSWSVGFVWDVTNNFSFGLDYWNTKIKDSIDTLPETAIFADPRSTRVGSCAVVSYRGRGRHDSTCMRRRWNGRSVGLRQDAEHREPRRHQGVGNRSQPAVPIRRG